MTYSFKALWSGTAEPTVNQTGIVPGKYNLVLPKLIVENTFPSGWVNLSETDFYLQTQGNGIWRMYGEIWAILDPASSLGSTWVCKTFMDSDPTLMSGNSDFEDNIFSPTGLEWAPQATLRGEDTTVDGNSHTYRLGVYFDSAASTTNGVATPYIDGMAAHSYVCMEFEPAGT